MNQTTLHLIYKAMMYTARQLNEGEPLHDKYFDLENMIDERNDYDLEDMKDNIEIVYSLIDKDRLEF
ncbi:hypothetical protein LCM23_06370 [Cytobacillus kochii]|uniref:hypothetical protein n=1 Tax=Cytobacillus kochii TaxID=859143 RepID=UPI001CD20D9F|nr:hypothetical protein [Cytobacillus kochii]MCA1025710.1 hypothetical protein [Cytobacillus kochii]